MASESAPFVFDEALLDYPYALIAFDLEGRRVLAANELAYDLLGREPPSLNGLWATELVNPDDWAAAEKSVELLASGAIEGYRAVRRFPNPDGTDLTASVWVRRTARDGYRYGLVIIEPVAEAAPWPLFAAGVKIALAVTDHDWVIEQVSSDIEGILDRSPESIKGSAFLGLVQPADVQNFLLATGRVVDDRGGATLRIHLRGGHDQWREVWCLVVAMCRHSPPRLGLSLAATPEFDVASTPELHRQLAVLGHNMFDDAEHFPPPLSGECFSTRQWEIIRHLVQGETVKDIAAALYLSPSTVRNHLSAIYRKFGVHSQAALLAKILQPSG